MDANIVNKIREFQYNTLRFCIFLIISALYLPDFGLRKPRLYRHETPTFMPPFCQKGA